MPIYLKGNGGNIALKTSGVPQSQINDLLADQKEKIDAQYAEQIDGLNTEIKGLETEITELQAIVSEYPTPVEGVEF